MFSVAAAFTFPTKARWQSGVASSEKGENLHHQVSFFPAQEARCCSVAQATLSDVSREFSQFFGLSSLRHKLGTSPRCGGSR